MKIQYRLGIFETNSSSCHSLVVSPEPAHLPTMVSFGAPNQYGWEEGEEDPLNYFWAMLNSDAEKDELIDKFFNILREHGIKIVLRDDADDPNEYSDYSYIDHYDGEITRYLLARPDLLLRFLFNSHSAVFCGNDNDCYDYEEHPECCCAEDFELGHKDEAGHGYFFKGN